MVQIEENVREKVKSLLRELFQFDNQDLDFGIYRILNFKRKEVERFIEHDLIIEAENQFKEYCHIGQADLITQLDTLKSEIVRDFGEGTIDSQGKVLKNQDAPKIKQYIDRLRLLNEANLTQSQISDVFNHVYEFFSRYYEKGDFISKRRYGGKSKYSIPYNGEELTLYWATRDMYYVKTGEFFKKYRFKAGRYLVAFILDNAKIEIANIKGENKYFILSSVNPITVNDEAGLIFIKFNYRPLTIDEIPESSKNSIQDDFVKKAVTQIVALLEDYPVPPTFVSSVDGKSLIEKHLNTYVSRNSKDFFIHKNLRGFLENELDFYLKNEVWDLNDLQLGERDLKLASAKVTAIRNIGGKIIAFLDQIESFQKDLFEKKKLVLRTDYCITLDLIDQKYYSFIASNEQQIAEWSRVLSFNLNDKIKGLDCQLVDYGKTPEEKAIAVLRQYPTLVIDTKYFDQSFKSDILNNITDLDECITGVLIKSENFQALNLLSSKKESAAFCYIDPPYNTGGDEFLYKDNYQHSSWLSMLKDRLEIARTLLTKEGVLFVSIGQDEIDNLIKLCDSIFERSNRIGIISRVMKTGGNKGRFLSPNIEYILAYARDISLAKPFREELSKELIEKVYNQFETQGILKGKRYRVMGLYQAGLDVRPNQRYWIKCPDGDFVIPPGTNIPKLVSDGEQIEPKSTDGVWTCTYSRFKKELEKNNIIFKETNTSPLISSQGKQSKWNIYTKIWLDDRQESGRVPVDFITRFENRHSSAELKGLGIDYPFAKPSNLIKHLMKLQNDNSGKYFIDFFAGSGTTGNSALSLTQEDGRKRRFILIEMDDYFDTILKPRIIKVIFSKEWKDGEPSSKDGSQKQIIKYQNIEQYEDSLNNIEFMEKDGSLQKTLDHLPDYFLSHVLKFESNSVLSSQNFHDPFNFKLKVFTDGKEEETSVDLVETFNYLIGLTVDRLLSFKNEQAKYQVVFGRKEDKSFAVIWRNIENLNLEKDKSFIESNILAGKNFDKVFINGDSYVKNAYPIEPEFKRLMGA